MHRLHIPEQCDVLLHLSIDKRMFSNEGSGADAGRRGSCK